MLLDQLIFRLAEPINIKPPVHCQHDHCRQNQTPLRRGYINYFVQVVSDETSFKAARARLLPQVLFQIGQRAMPVENLNRYGIGHGGQMQVPPHPFAAAQKRAEDNEENEREMRQRRQVGSKLVKHTSF